MSDLETLSEQLTKMIQLHVNPALGVDENKARLIVALDLLCALQQHEATIAEQGTTISVLDGDLQNAKCGLAAAQAAIAECNSRIATLELKLKHACERDTMLDDLCDYMDQRNEARARVSECEKVIQQQALKLEEADYGLLQFHQWFVRHAPPGVEYSDRLYNAFVASKARHSARAQQAEAKKEE